MFNARNIQIEKQKEGNIDPISYWFGYSLQMQIQKQAFENRNSGLSGADNNSKILCLCGTLLSAL